ncbi:MAG: SoxR reducing system RseC family protein [Deferrisomatales bacterium]|nr:SoxR reducing system RseC family protein [Deferrisomatales bacterium]
MIEARGWVVEVRPGRALVDTTGAGACESCGAGRACSCSGGGGGRRIWAEDPVGVAPGEWVVLGISEETLVRAGVLVYLVPAAALVIGAAVGHALAPALGFSPDLGAASLGILGLVAALVVSRLLGGRSSDGPRVLGRV